MTELPTCDLCKSEGADPVEPAEYDVKTTLGPHGYLCQKHFEQYGTAIGTKLVRPIKQADETLEKADTICRKCGKDCTESSWNKTEMRFRLLARPEVIEVMVMTGLYCEEVMSFV